MFLVAAAAAVVVVVVVVVVVAHRSRQSQKLSLMYSSGTSHFGNVGADAPDPQNATLGVAPDSCDGGEARRGVARWSNEVADEMAVVLQI